MQFYCKMGTVETTVPWTKPSFLTLKYLLLHINENTTIFSRYKVEIYGKVLFSWNTMDIDISLTSDYSKLNHEQLDLDMIEITDICLNKFRILPDIQYHINKKNKIRSPKNKDLFFYKSENDLLSDGKSIRIRNFYKKSETELMDVNHDGINVSDNLILRDIIPNEPYFEKREDIVYFMDAKDIMKMDEDEFNEKSNRFNI